MRKDSFDLFIRDPLHTNSGELHLQKPCPHSSAEPRIRISTCDHERDAVLGAADASLPVLAISGSGFADLAVVLQVANYLADNSSRSRKNCDWTPGPWFGSASFN